jgi:hypothetical protein
MVLLTLQSFVEYAFDNMFNRGGVEGFLLFWAFVAVVLFVVCVVKFKKLKPYRRRVIAIMLCMTPILVYVLWRYIPG